MGQLTRAEVVEKTASRGPACHNPAVEPTQQCRTSFGPSGLGNNVESLLIPPWRTKLPLVWLKWEDKECPNLVPEKSRNTNYEHTRKYEHRYLKLIADNMVAIKENTDFTSNGFPSDRSRSRPCSNNPPQKTSRGWSESLQQHKILRNWISYPRIGHDWSFRCMSYNRYEYLDHTKQFR